MDYKRIPLDKNGTYSTKVDPDVYDNLMQFNWRKLGKYAFTTIDNVTTSMHSYLLGKAPQFHVIDHIDKDGLNNTRQNLRIATVSVNNQNRDKRKGCTSEYIGVSWHPDAKKWICWSGKEYLGSFDDEIDAAVKYDTYTMLKYGEISSHNNLVNYDEIKDIDKNTLLCKREDRDLPKNIQMKRGEFIAKIEYKTKIYSSTQQKTLEDALQELVKLKEKLEAIKIQEMIDHNNQEILRNEQNIAVIPMYNRKKEVTYTMVSDDKWHEVMKYKWSLTTAKYAQSVIDGDHIRLHRFILNAADDVLIDHINNNKLDNRTENLRISNSGNNSHNRKKNPNASSKYYGVSFEKKSQNWKSEIRKDNKRYNIGNFKTEQEAAIAYNKKATELYGEFAKLNIIEPEDNSIIEQIANLQI